MRLIQSCLRRMPHIKERIVFLISPIGNIYIEGIVIVQNLDFEISMDEE